MSPEQIKGSDPDGRSDLYSLGITMYEMVTGRRPFLGDSDFQIMSAHLQQAPMAPIEVIPGIPSELSEIILMAIEKDPAARFQSAEAFRAALASAFPAAMIPTRTMLPVPVPVAAAPVAASAFPTMSPPPMPHAMPPPPADAPWMVPPAPARSNRRGLYMALGSMLTLAVLVAAVIEGPKLMRGGASDAQGVPATTATPAVAATPAAATPGAATPGAATPVDKTQAAATSSPTAGARETIAPAAASTPAPVELPRPIQQPVPAQYSFRPAQPPPQSKRAAKPSAVAQAGPVAQAAPYVQPAPAPAPPPVTAATASPELKELRDRINRISVRAAAAQAGVRSIEDGVERQGLGLRGDIKAASIRLDYVLQEARASLQNGDVQGARNNLQYAEGTLQKIEKFLGQ
jgi:serine/threonine-protein kinase